MKDNKMGLFSAVAAIVGGCIGSAIFSISGMTVSLAGGLAPLSWVVAAVIMGAYGIVVTRLAVRYPQSGGIFVFPRRVFHGTAGRFLGFFSAWGYIVSNVIAIGFSAVVAGMYFAAGFPQLCVDQSTPLVFSCAVLLVSLLVILSGGRSSKLLQNVFVLLLVVTLLVYCIAACCCPGGAVYDGSSCGFAALFSGSLGGMLRAVPLSMVAYGACVAVAFMSADVRNPSRNLPRALMIGLALVAALYVAVIVAIVITLPLGVLRSETALCFSPLLSSVSHGSLVFLPWLSKVVAIASIFAQITTIIVLTRVNSRALQAVVWDGFLPLALGRENKGGVPYAAVTLMTCLGLVICFLSRWIWEIISLGAVLNVVSMVITCAAAVFAFRRGCPETDTAFRRLRAISFPIIVSLLLLVCYVPDILNGNMALWIFTLAVYLCGAVVFAFGRGRTSKLSSESGTCSLHGVVVHGKGHGHLHGMPTANLQPDSGAKLPRFGVWETRVYVDGACHKGLTNVGLRPSDDDSPVPTVETLVLDFSGDLYGRKMTLEFVRFVRPTLGFSSLDDLKQQIDKDIESIRV